MQSEFCWEAVTVKTCKAKELELNFASQTNQSMIDWYAVILGWKFEKTKWIESSHSKIGFDLLHWLQPQHGSKNRLQWQSLWHGMAGMALFLIASLHSFTVSHNYTWCWADLGQLAMSVTVQTVLCGPAWPNKAWRQIDNHNMFLNHLKFRDSRRYFEFLLLDFGPWTFWKPGTIGIKSDYDWEIKDLRI